MYRFALGLAIVMSAASAQGQSPSASSQPPLTTRATPRLLPGTRVDVFSTIRGSAFDSEDAKLPSSLVRHREAGESFVITQKAPVNAALDGRVYYGLKSWTGGHGTNVWGPLP